MLNCKPMQHGISYTRANAALVRAYQCDTVRYVTKYDSSLHCLYPLSLNIILISNPSLEWSAIPKHQNQLTLAIVIDDEANSNADEYGKRWNSLITEMKCLRIMWNEIYVTAHQRVFDKDRLTDDSKELFPSSVKESLQRLQFLLDLNYLYDTCELL